jgi:hypothetical protein
VTKNMAFPDSLAYQTSLSCLVDHFATDQYESFLASSFPTVISMHPLSLQ